MNAKSWLCLLLACLVAGYVGYHQGAEATAAEWRALLAEADARRSDEDRARAEAVAAAEKCARERLQAEVGRGNELARRLAVAKSDLDAEKASVNKRITNVSQAARRDCAGLSADWVRVYNDALGLASGPGSGSGGQSAVAAGTRNSADAAGTAGSRVRPDALATPEDVLAHIRDYGAYCQTLANQAQALIDFYKEPAHD